MSDTIQDLERRINQEQAILSRYEDLRQREKDPREISNLEAKIEDAKMLLLGLQTKLAQLRATISPPPHMLARPRPTLLANAPYGLETTLVGREAERLILDDWYHRDPAHPFLAIIGLGGQGKSALAWDWLQNLIRQGQTPPLVMWWSFYETDGTLDNLTAELLRTFGEERRNFPSLRAAVSQVIHHLQTKPALLVLDGAERLLRAYSSMSAAYQGDEVEAETLEQARQCADPVVGTMLTWLAQPGLTGAQTLLTSRLMPQELSGRGGSGLTGVRRHDLTGLRLEDALHLFTGLEIQTTRAEVEAVCEPLGYHPLSLRLLARYVAHDPQSPNDLRAAANYDPTADLLGKRQHILKQAYDSLPKRAGLLLSRLAAFRGSVAWEVAEAVLGRSHTSAVAGVPTAPRPARSGDRPEQLRKDLELLERRGLVQRTVKQVVGKTETSYDLHPIVRRYAYDRLADPVGTHAQLVEYFKAVPQPDKVRSLNDLLPTIELYHHLARAERYDEAWILYKDRLWKHVYYQLGEYQTQIECLSALFPDGIDKLPRLKSKAHQAHACNELANSYSMFGQSKAANTLFEQYIASSHKQGNRAELAIGLVNLTQMIQIPIGAFKAATHNLHWSSELGKETGDKAHEAVYHQIYGYLLAHCGDWTKASAELDIALKLAQFEDEFQIQSLTWAYCALVALLCGDGVTATTTAEKALLLVEESARTRYSMERDYVRTYWLLGWAALARGQLAQAQTHLDEALHRCRTINAVAEEPKILLAHARLARAVGQNAILPYELAEEARHIAERAEYRLDLADIHNFLAQLALDGGDRATALAHAQRARDYAWCDGPPYAYQVALDEAERLLGIMKDEL